MQLIAETYFICRNLLNLTPVEIADLFATWKEGRLASFLAEITEEILRAVDSETGKPMLDTVFDRARQKGTGRWAAEAALELDVPAPTLSAGVFARSVSMRKQERLEASQVFPRPKPFIGESGPVVCDLENALYASMACAYAQGFAVLAAASERYGWDMNLAKVAAIWRGGCIIRARLLDTVREAFAREPHLTNLLMAPGFRDDMAGAADGWRRLMGVATGHGMPLPAMVATQAYYEAYRSPRLWANVIQAQRDRFGAHGFERVDRPGKFHGDWSEG